MEFDQGEELLGDKDRTEIIGEMNRECVDLLMMHGSVREPRRILSKTMRLPVSLEPRRTMELSQNVKIRDQDWLVNILSSSENPQNSEFIEIRIGKSVNVLYLRWEDAWIMQDWKTGEANVFIPEGIKLDEYSNRGGLEEKLKPATVEDMLQFRLVIDLLMEDLGL